MFGVHHRRGYTVGGIFHWSRMAIAVVIAVAAGLSPVRAQSAPQPAPVAQYAQALRYFNKHLSPRSSRSLAMHVLRDAYVHSLDPRLLVALVAVESSWRQQAVSRSGARGLGQLMPGTAQRLGVDAREPFANLAGTAAYLSALLAHFAPYDGDTQLAYAIGAYNAGPKAILRYHGIPPYHETRRYVAKVLGLWRRLSDPTLAATKLPVLPPALPEGVGPLTSF